jgi:hypothetical protein
LGASEVTKMLKAFSVVAGVLLITAPAVAETSQYGDRPSERSDRGMMGGGMMPMMAMMLQMSEMMDTCTKMMKPKTSPQGTNPQESEPDDQRPEDGRR